MSAEDKNDTPNFEDMTDVLTPEEIEAMRETPSPEEREALERIASGDVGNDDGEDDGDDDQGGANGAGSADASPADATSAPAPDAAKVDEQPVRVQNSYTAELPADFEQQVASIKTDLAGLTQKFREGEIDVDEYEVQRGALDDKRRELDQQQLKAQIAQEMAEQSGAQQWQAAVERGMAYAAKPENGGIDYRKDATKAQDLDAFVKVLGNDPKNADKDMDWFLREGHRRVLALHGIATRQAAAPAAPADKGKTQRRDPDLSQAKSLAHVPGSDGPGDVGSEFAAIDALDGLEMEAALARLTPEQRARYERGG